MFPFIQFYLAARVEAVERERKRRREEEQVMTGYSPQDLSGNWQFKIVKGTFKKPHQIEAVIQEQAEYGWVLVEVFDENRIRFKRPAAEAAKDTYREGNPYATVSRASGPGCGTAVLAAALVIAAFSWWV
jgi:hypothetical protein